MARVIDKHIDALMDHLEARGVRVDMILFEHLMVINDKIPNQKPDMPAPPPPIIPECPQ